jgi:hypothetical protein
MSKCCRQNQTFLPNRCNELGQRMRDIDSAQYIPNTRSLSFLFRSCSEGVEKTLCFWSIIYAQWVRVHAQWVRCTFHNKTLCFWSMSIVINKTRISALCFSGVGGVKLEKKCKVSEVKLIFVRWTGVGTISHTWILSPNYPNPISLITILCMK